MAVDKKSLCNRTTFFTKRIYREKGKLFENIFFSEEINIVPVRGLETSSLPTFNTSLLPSYANMISVGAVREVVCKK